MRAGLAVYLKGFAMGSADIVPGVSGGTIALIVGVYDRMIAAITAIDPHVLWRLPTVYRADSRQALYAELRAMDLPFLLTLGSGAISAVIVLANAMHYMAVEHPVPTYGFFTGLIAASAVVLYGEVNVTTPRRVLVAVIGILVAVAITGVTGTGVTHALPIIFLAGMVAICAMVLPGVSGSFLLLILGQYEYMTGTLDEATDAILDALGGGSPAALVEPLTVVAVFGAGAIIGLFSMAHLIERAFERHRAATMTFLVSLMVGALWFPIQKVDNNLGESASNSPTIALLSIVFGAALVLLADRYAVDRPTVSNPA